MMFGSLPNWSRQTRPPSTTTSRRPDWSSASVNVRPSIGATPNTSKYCGLTRMPVSICASPGVAMLACQSANTAIASKLCNCCCQSTNVG